MPQPVETVRVMPSHPSQGEWVIINAADFDPAVHQLYEPGFQPAAVAQPSAEMPKRRGRPPKHLKEAINGYR
ncbi:MAG: hypothetical protein RI906_1097 [Pseudomonadota bacterium]